MVLQEINKILAKDNEMKVQTSDGKLHDLKPNMQIDNATIIIIDLKENLYNYLFGKKRISEKDVTELVETFEKVKKYIYDNSSYAMKKKLKEIIK